MLNKENRNKNYGNSCKQVILRYIIVSVILFGLSFSLTTLTLHDGYLIQSEAIKTNLRIIAVLNLMMGCFHIVKHNTLLKKHKNAENIRIRSKNPTSVESYLPDIDTSLSTTPPKFLLIYFSILYILVTIISLEVELEYALRSNLVNMTLIIEKVQMHLTMGEDLLKIITMILTVLFIPWLISTDPYSTTESEWEVLSYGFVGPTIFVLGVVIINLLAEIRPFVSPEQIKNVILLSNVFRIGVITSIAGMIMYLSKVVEGSVDNIVKIWGE